MTKKNLRHKVIMIGPKINGKGGMAESVRNLLQSEFVKHYEVVYLETIVSGFIFRKISVTITQLVRFLFICFLSRPDIVHIHFCSGVSFYRKSIFVILTKLFRLKIIMQLHGGEFIQFYSNSLPFIKIYILKILDASNRLILISKSKFCWANKMLKKTKIDVIPNIFKLPPLLSNKYNKKKEKYLSVIFMGVIERHKGIYDLIESIPHIVKKNNQVKFIICGEGEIDNIKKVCEIKNINNYVEFKGWVNGKLKFELLQKSDILVLPSYYEELPYAILEGLSVGLPIAASDVGGISFLIKNEVNGILFKPGNIEQIAKSLNYLIENPNLRIQMFKNNRQLIREFSQEKIVPKFMNIYRELIHNQEYHDNL